MSISIQLVEIPENEQVSNRQVAFPIAGGTIGRAYDCTLQLPDFNKKLSRVHAQISLDSTGCYQVADKSANGLFVNGSLLGKGQYKAIDDGDVWKIGDYTLLVSNMSSLIAAVDEPVISAAASRERIADPAFDLDGFDLSGTHFIDTDNVKMRSSTSSETYDFNTDVDVSTQQKKSEGDAMFSASNALEDVQLGYDPFEESFEMHEPSPVMRDSVTLEAANTSGADIMQQNLIQLTQLIQQQRQSTTNDPYSYDTLMECIQLSMDRFIEELSPQYLEEMFNGYVSGWGSRDKKYWRLYKKQFDRKLEKKEFHRQFAAIFMEELRGKM